MHFSECKTAVWGQYEICI